MKKRKVSRWVLLPALFLFWLVVGSLLGLWARVSPTAARNVAGLLIVVSGFVWMKLMWPREP